MKKILKAAVGILFILIIAGCPTPTDPTPSSDKTITAFSFTAAGNAALSNDVAGTISGTDITVTVPYGTDVNALVATFTTTGTGLVVGSTAQTSGTTANNFTSPVTYTVEAEDGTTLDYIVTVTIAAASENFGFSTASSLGDSGILTLSESSETLKMIYANNQDSITFPTGSNDSGNATLTRKFFMGETEVTNAVMAAVLQWAYNSGRFSSIVDDPTGLDSATAKHGGQQLLDLDDVDCKLDYDVSGNFTVESGFENKPVTNVTWFGSVMFCNWLTEMRDGNTNNVVYAWIDNGDGEGTASDGIWQDDETDEDSTSSGYRLPTIHEWEYAARYLGTAVPSTGGYLDTEYVALDHNDDGTSSLTSEYFWTPGDYASGATADWHNTAACQVVAVYAYADPNPYDDEATVKSLGSTSANALGLYDMSGNVAEWCFTEGTSSRRYYTGGYWILNWTPSLSTGANTYTLPDNDYNFMGFRLCRTAD